MKSIELILLGLFLFVAIFLMARAGDQNTVTTTTSGSPLRGRVEFARCIQVAGRCFASDAIARVARTTSAAGGALVWLKGGSDVTIRPTAPPTGAFEFVPRGGAGPMQIDWRDVSDILFAFKQP